MRRAESLELAEVRSLRGPERPMSTIMSELVDHTSTLVRKELELAATELQEKAERAKVDAIEAAVGGVVLYAGVLALVTAAILLLSKAISPWLSALIVGVVVCAVGYALMNKSKRDLEREPLTPQKTVRSVQRTVHQLKEAVK